MIITTLSTAITSWLRPRRGGNEQENRKDARTKYTDTAAFRGQTDEKQAAVKLMGEDSIEESRRLGSRAQGLQIAATDTAREDQGPAEGALGMAASR